MTRKQVFETTLKYFDGDGLAANVWVDKYCLKNGDDYLELTPDDMHKRLAKEIARIEKKYPNPISEGEIYNLLKDFKYIVPQGGGMYGIGNNVLSSLSNCFVIGSDIDSYGNILLTDQEQVQLMKRRGGVGHDLSHIRPRGFRVNNSAESSSGVTPFMERYSNSTEEVAQNGRNGALMLSIDVAHPDAEEFVDIKTDTSKVTKANVSIKASEEFMDAALSNGLYDKVFKGKVVKQEKAKPLFDKLVKNAWKSAEPGLLFFDRILSESPARGYGKEWKEVSTNPCGELPLPPFDSCRLLAINLSSYVKNPFFKNSVFDKKKLSKHVKIAQRLLDDFIDLEIEKIDSILRKISESKEPEHILEVEKTLWKKIKNKAIQGRRTGLGYTGLGDMMAALGITYGSEESIDFISDLQQLFGSSSYIASIELAKERGAFPIWNFDKDQKSDFIKRMFAKTNFQISDSVFEQYTKTGRKNIGNLTIAPTGSVSLMTQTTSGIEPLFSPYHFRKKKILNSYGKFDFEDESGDKWVEFTVFHKPFVQWFSVEAGLRIEAAKTVLKNQSRDQLNETFKRSPYYRATAQDVNYINKVKMQGAAQRWVDHSISVTVNMPENATEDTVRQVYKTAYHADCKGVTVYRENSRGNVLSTKSVKEVKAEDFSSISAAKRPKILECDVFFTSVRGQKHIVFVGLLSGKPYEVFAVLCNEKISIPKKSKRGVVKKVKKGHYKYIGENETVIENLCDHMVETEQNETRLVSGLLRHRVDPVYIARMLGKFSTISSLHKAIGKVILKYVNQKEGVQCPECKEQMTMTEGCMKCSSCGCSHCG